MQEAKSNKKVVPNPCALNWQSSLVMVLVLK